MEIGYKTKWDAQRDSINNRKYLRDKEYTPLVRMKKSWISTLKKDFNLNGVTEVYFWKSEWEKFDPHDHDTPVSLYYFAYRFFFMAWFVGTYTQNFFCTGYEDNSFYAIYLTNQTFTFQLIYAVVYFLYISWTFWRKYRSPKVNNNSLDRSNKLESNSFHYENYRLPIICKLLWMTINILNVIPYVVTVIYWLFLFDSNDERRTCEVLVNLFTHALNSPLVLIDTFVISVPIRRTHAIFPALFAVYYTVFSGLYEVFNGRYNAEDDKDYIYPMLDWRNNPGFAVITCVGAYIGSFIIHFVMSWGLYRLRIYIHSRFTKLSNEPIEVAT